MLTNSHFYTTLNWILEVVFCSPAELHCAVLRCVVVYSAQQQNDLKEKKKDYSCLIQWFCLSSRRDLAHPAATCYSWDVNTYTRLGQTEIQSHNAHLEISNLSRSDAAGSNIHLSPGPTDTAHVEGPGRRSQRCRDACLLARQFCTRAALCIRGGNTAESTVL